MNDKYAGAAWNQLKVKDKQLAFNNEKSNERLPPPQTGLYGLLLDTDEDRIVGGELSE